MPQPTLMTGWTCIATSGPTADGRVIEPQWLIDAAETYSRNTYTAMLWPWHADDYGSRQFTNNFGEVDALKVETEGDKVKLYARLIPNQFLIEANSYGQKLFTSAELVGNFAQSGRDYLIGVCVTDIPASLGTQKVSFMMNDQEYTCQRTSVQAFSMGALAPREGEAPAPAGRPQSFLRRLFSAGQNGSTDNEKPDTGEEAKMEEIKALLEKLLALVQKGDEAAAGDGTAETTEEAQAEVADVAADIADAAAEVAELAEEVAANPEDEVKAEEFALAKGRLADAIRAYSAVKPVKGERYRRFSARRKPDSQGNDVKALAAQLETLTAKLSATETTPRPSGAPSGQEKPFDFV